MPLRKSESKVLLALLREGEMPIMTLPKSADLGGGAVYNSIRWLSERGLAVDQREKEPPRRRMIRLTDKGKKLASMLEQIERQL
ncbi:MAG: helix-turn-helix transcriptional regulator [Nitrososphaerota archaeon]|nr:helix-turn-helix transcriptional regulator [Nitrososphaerota archaeon]